MAKTCQFPFWDSKFFHACTEPAVETIVNNNGKAFQVCERHYKIITTVTKKIEEGILKPERMGQATKWLDRNRVSR
jgi:hypothetical protein